MRPAATTAVIQLMAIILEAFRDFILAAKSSMCRYTIVAFLCNSANDSRFSKLNFKIQSHETMAASSFVNNIQMINK